MSMPVPDLKTLIVEAFAGSTANERARAVTVTAAKMFKDFGIIKNSQLRGTETRPEEERNDLGKVRTEESQGGVFVL
jgi:hypothetical protein